MSAQQRYTYTTRPLYGGALTASIPSTFLDASNVRQIPDTQEVFLSPDSSTSTSTTSTKPSSEISLIIDLAERAAPPEHPCTTDEEALRYHFADYVDTGIAAESQNENRRDKPRILRVRRVNAVGLGEACAAALGLAALDANTNASADGDAEGQTLLLFSLLRLERVKTDVLVAVNATLPGVVKEEGNEEKELESPGAKEAMEIMEHVVSSLTVAEGGWSLFGE